LIDEHGAKAARKEVSMIKALVPMLHTTVLDRAMQAFGAMGVSPDTPLADHWTWGRALRYADGPDEVHHRAVARMEVKESGDYLSLMAAYLTPYAPD
ncbi:MAG: acyl-CoA dehydrogenase, partial [Proteobacteria bacterium]|nr:acyl-CoA dehydrogenase [Pseudomonadota bacterium]